MAGIDINRGTSGAPDLLPKEISTEIWGDVQEQSAVMRLARQINLPGSGSTIPIITGDAAADWVDLPMGAAETHINMGSIRVDPLLFSSAIGSMPRFARTSQ